MPGLVVHEASHVFPVMKVKRTGGKSRAVSFVGMGFVLEGGLFATCWHCVSPDPPPRFLRGPDGV